MPKDNYAFRPGFSISPDWIPADDVSLPGLGQLGTGRPDFIPDPDAEPENKITRGQEMYGLDYVEGEPPPKRKKIKPFLRNDGFRAD